MVPRARNYQAAELRRWIDEGAYTRMLRGDYPRRGDDRTTSTRQDVKDATEHYTTAFARSQDALVSLLRDVGGGTVAGLRDWATSFGNGRNRGGNGA